MNDGNISINCFNNTQDSLINLQSVTKLYFADFFYSYNKENLPLQEKLHNLSLKNFIFYL